MGRFWFYSDGKDNSIGYVVRTGGWLEGVCPGTCEMELPSTKMGKAAGEADLGDMIRRSVWGTLT